MRLITRFYGIQSVALLFLQKPIWEWLKLLAAACYSWLYEEGEGDINMSYALSQQCSPPAVRINNNWLFTHVYNCTWCHPPSVLETVNLSRNNYQIDACAQCLHDTKIINKGNNQGGRTWVGRTRWCHLHPPHTTRNSMQLQAALAIPRLYFGGFRLHQCVLCMFVESLSTDAPYLAATNARSDGLK